MNEKPSAATTQSPLLSPDAAAAHLMIHPRTLSNWRVQGRGPRYCRIGRQALYRQADIDEWVDGRVYAHTAAEHNP